MDATTLALAKAYTNSQRLAYIEGGKVILPEKLYPAEYEAEGQLDLVPGEKYTVTVNGEKYVCEAFKAEDGWVIIEHVNPLFGVYNDPTSNIYGATLYDDNGEALDVVIGVTTEETIHPIDPKYLPGAVLPVVEITSAEYPIEITDSGLNATGEIVALSADESAQFDKLSKLGTPVIVKVPALGGSIATVCTFVTFEGVSIFAGDAFLDVHIQFTHEGDTWSMGG